MIASFCLDPLPNLPSFASHELGKLLLCMMGCYNNLTDAIETGSRTCKPFNETNVPTFVVTTKGLSDFLKYFMFSGIWMNLKSSQLAIRRNEFFAKS